MNPTHIYTNLGTMVTGQKEMQFMKDKSHVIEGEVQVDVESR